MKHYIQDSLGSATGLYVFLSIKRNTILVNVGMQTTIMSFFKRSGVYNLDCFGKVGYKTNVKTAKQIWEHMFYASI